MGANANVTLSVTLKDSASASLLRSLGLIDQQTGKIATDAAKAGSALDNMGRNLGSGQGAVKGISRELDGVASKAQKVGERLNSGLRTALQQAKQLGQLGMSLGAGVAAGAMVLKPQVDFDRQMSLNAGVMFGTRDDQGRLYTRAEADAQKARLTRQVDASVAGGAGTRDQAMLAQNTLLASGQFNGEEGLRRLDALMPNIMRASASSGTDPQAMANMAVAFANKGYNDQQINAAIAKGMVADSMGSFGVKSMANWMPKWLAGAGDALKGEHAADALFVHAQQVRKVSGTEDEAGTNLENIIGYAASNKGDKDLKDKYGVDRKQAIAKNMEKGDDFLTAYARMVDDVAKNDKGFQTLKAKAKAAGTDQERSQVYDEMAAYAQQGILGDIVGDLQAKKGLFAIMSNMDKSDTQKMFEAVKNENGSYINDSFSQRVNGDAKTAYDGTANAKDQGLTSALGWLSPFIQKVAGVASANPTATGVGALGLAVGGTGFGLASLLRLFSGGAAAAGGAATAGGAALAGGAGLLAGGKLLLRRAGILGAGIGVAGDVMTLASDRSTANERREAKYSLGGTAAGAAVGGIVGSIVPVLGTALGASLGSALGGFLGGKIADWTAPAQAPQVQQAAQMPAIQPPQPSQELIQANAQLQQANAQLAQINQSANNDKLLGPLGQIQGGIASLNAKSWTVQATIPVYVDGHVVAQTVNTINGQQASRG